MPEWSEFFKPFHCDNGKTYMAHPLSCFFCRYSDIFWDYTNGPYVVLCMEAEASTDDGLIGNCNYFKEV